MTDQARFKQIHGVLYDSEHPHRPPLTTVEGYREVLLDVQADREEICDAVLSALSRLAIYVDETTVTGEHKDRIIEGLADIRDSLQGERHVR